MTDQKAPSASYIERAQRAFALHAQRNLDGAAELCRELIEEGPPFRDVLHLLGVVEIQRGEFHSALSPLEQALRLDPKNMEVLFQLALAYENAGNLEKAAQVSISALGVSGGEPLNWIQQAYLLRRAGYFEEAGHCIDRALELRPDDPAILHEKGYHLHHFARNWDDAASYYLRARAHTSSDLKPWVNYAILARTQGLWTDLESRLSEAYEHFPDDPIAQNYYAMELLRHQRFSEGWPLFEARYLRPDMKRVDVLFDAPFWNGEDLSDSHILFWTDQGIGDELMGLQVAAPALHSAKQVTLVCTEALQGVVERCFPSFKVVTHEALWDENLSLEADFQATYSHIAQHTIDCISDIQSLPQAFKPDAELVAKFRSKYGGSGDPLVGIAWKSPKALNADHKGSALSDWEPVFDVPGLQFVCVQYGVTEDERSWLRERLGSRIAFDDSLEDGKDMDSWMAQACAMDLNITVSTTTAHLTGVCRKPSWTLLTAGDGLTWYWFLDRTDSPWYPKARLFRQSEPTQWAPVFDAVAQSLGQHFSSPS